MIQNDTANTAEKPQRCRETEEPGITDAARAQQAAPRGDSRAEVARSPSASRATVVQSIAILARA